MLPASYSYQEKKKENQKVFSPIFLERFLSGLVGVWV